MKATLKRERMLKARERDRLIKMVSLGEDREPIRISKPSFFNVPDEIEEMMGLYTYLPFIMRARKR